MPQESGEIVIEKLTNFEIGDEAGLAMARALFGMDKPYQPIADAPIEEPMLHEQVTTGEYDAVLADALGGEADPTDWSGYLHDTQLMPGLGQEELGAESTDQSLGQVSIFATDSGVVHDTRMEALKRFDRWQGDNTSQPERQGFFRRNMSKVAMAAGALVTVGAVILGFGMSERGTTNEVADIAPAPTEETIIDTSTSTTVVPETTITTMLELPEQNAMPELSPAPLVSPEQQPDPFVSAEGVATTVKINKGDTVWDILQTELTGSHVGEVDFDPEVTRTIFAVMDELAQTNGFGDDTDKLSGLDVGYDLKFSETANRLIAEFRAARGLGA